MAPMECPTPTSVREWKSTSMPLPRPVSTACIHLAYSSQETTQARSASCLTTTRPRIAALTRREVTPREGLLVQHCRVPVVGRVDGPRLAYPHAAVPRNVLVEVLERRLPVLLVEARAVREDKRERVGVGAAVPRVPVSLRCDLQTCYRFQAAQCGGLSG